VGPGGGGFVFTGSMSGWRSATPSGVKGLSHWTYANGTTEGNGATWSPRLSPGLYDVAASIPPVATTTSARYTIKDARGATTEVINQQASKGYRSLGTYTAKAGIPISVHVGDNGPSSTSTRVGVDAMAFRLVASAPSAPRAISAVGGDGQAVVSWSPASANGSPITRYRVTASPGGATASVNGTTTSMTISGLTNGTSYSFIVTATNAAGISAASPPSAAVTAGTVPGMPTAVSASSGDARAKVSWSAPASSGGSAVTSYTVTAAPGGRTATTAGLTTTVTGLTNGIPHTFTVTAANAAGSSRASSPSAPVTFQTVPGAPTNVRAMPGNTRAVVTWRAPASGGGSAITAYTVTAAPGGRSATTTGSPAGLTANVTGLTSGKSYTFTVTATNAAGTSPASLASPVATIAATSATRLSDFNSDGVTDLVARDAAGILWLYPGSGTGAFLPRSKLGASWAGMTAIVTPGDVNGDGHADILARDTAGRLWFHAGNGSSRLAARRRIGSGWQSYTITGAADLTGTGRPDLLARDSAGTLWLFPFGGNARLGTRTKIGTGWNGYTITGPGDLTGDGRADILARNAAGSLWLYPGKGSGGSGGLRARTLISHGWAGRTALVTPGNWDRTAGNDLLARDAGGRLWVYPGNNAGGFGAKRQIGTSTWKVMTYLG
jgi:hypothetical protein